VPLPNEIRDRVVGAEDRTLVCNKAAQAGPFASDTTDLQSCGGLDALGTFGDVDVFWLRAHGG
jgi:hypothetical protein